jgi:hypothetical protein
LICPVAIDGAEYCQSISQIEASMITSGTKKGSPNLLPFLARTLKGDIWLKGG